jgi:uncharacterized repeat protein (TIGR01451 family)
VKEVTVMDFRWLRRWGWLLLIVVLALGLGVSLTFADAPQPNPLTGSSTFSKDLGYLDIKANGPAATIHGDPMAGRDVYAKFCANCHGPAGIGGVPNLGSDDGTIPPLNPADPGFAGDTRGDAATFAENLDLFIQHGSKPSGDDPKLSMPGWGDGKLLTQQQVADVEAFIMQLNGVYWSDRWAPPAEVQMTADRKGDLVTYTINLINDGASDMEQVTLRDTLPAGLTYVTSGLPGLGQNPGKWNGTTVAWDTTVPQGGVTGPFIIVARAQGNDVPANVAQASFAWTDLGGNTQDSTAISNKVMPASAKPTAALPANAAVQAAAVAPATSAPALAKVAPSETPSPTATPEANATVVTPAAGEAPTAAPTATTAPTVAPTATQAPAAPVGDAAHGAQLFQTKTCVACHIINGAGGKVGPDLSHIGSTPYNGMANDAAFLTRWLQDPQAFKPSTVMRRLDLTDAEINDLVAYLVSLK